MDDKPTPRTSREEIERPEPVADWLQDTIAAVGRACESGIGRRAYNATLWTLIALEADKLQRPNVQRCPNGWVKLIWSRHGNQVSFAFGPGGELEIQAWTREALLHTDRYTHGYFERARAAIHWLFPRTNDWQPTRPPLQ